MFNHTRYAKYLGSGYAKLYVDQPLLVIGKDVWTRAECAKMGLTQTRACGILSAIAKDLGVKSLADLFERTSPYTFTNYAASFGTIGVLFAAFDDQDLDPEAWFGRGKKHAITTFMALKHRELKAAAREREDAKKRRRRGPAPSSPLPSS